MQDWERLRLKSKMMYYLILIYKMNDFLARHLSGFFLRSHEIINECSLSLMEVEQSSLLSVLIMHILLWHYRNNMENWLTFSKPEWFKLKKYDLIHLQVSFLVFGF